MPISLAELRRVVGAAWDAGRWDDDADFKVSAAQCRAVPDSDAADADGNPIATFHCSECGAGAWADADSVTPFCPMCGRAVANAGEWTGER